MPCRRRSASCRANSTVPAARRWPRHGRDDEPAFGTAHRRGQAVLGAGNARRDSPSPRPAAPSGRARRTDRGRRARRRSPPGRRERHRPRAGLHGVARADETGRGRQRAAARQATKRFMRDGDQTPCGSSRAPPRDNRRPVSASGLSAGFPGPQSNRRRSASQGTPKRLARVALGASRSKAAFAAIHGVQAAGTQQEPHLVRRAGPATPAAPGR
jgi:hypothetical protein